MRVPHRPQKVPPAAIWAPQLGQFIVDSWIGDENYLLPTASCRFLLRNCCASFSHRFSVRFLYSGAVLTASMHASIELAASWLSPNPACARPIKYSPCGS